MPADECSGCELCGGEARIPAKSVLKTSSRRLWSHHRPIRRDRGRRLLVQFSLCSAAFQAILLEGRLSAKTSKLLFTPLQCAVVILPVVFSWFVVVRTVLFIAGNPGFRCRLGNALHRVGAQQLHGPLFWISKVFEIVVSQPLVHRLLVFCFEFQLLLRSHEHWTSVEERFGRPVLNVALSVFTLCKNFPVVHIEC